MGTRVARTVVYAVTKHDQPHIARLHCMSRPQGTGKSANKGSAVDVPQLAADESLERLGEFIVAGLRGACASESTGFIHVVLRCRLSFMHADLRRAAGQVCLHLTAQIDFRSHEGTQASGSRVLDCHSNRRQQRAVTHRT